MSHGPDERAERVGVADHPAMGITWPLCDLTHPLISGKCAKRDGHDGPRHVTTEGLWWE